MEKIIFIFIFGAVFSFNGFDEGVANKEIVDYSGEVTFLEAQIGDEFNSDNLEYLRNFSYMSVFYMRMIYI